MLGKEAVAAAVTLSLLLITLRRMQRGGGKDKRDEDEVFLSVTASVTFVESNVGEKQLRSFLLLSVGTNGCKVKPGTLKEEEEKGVPLTPTPRGNSLRRVSFRKNQGVWSCLLC